MFEGEIIFYNGFNLLVDIIIGFIVFSVAYRWGKSDGYNDGFNEGAEAQYDHMLEQSYPEPDYFDEYFTGKDMTADDPNVKTIDGERWVKSPW